jgi:hypothetical protein
LSPFCQRRQYSPAVHNIPSLRRSFEGYALPPVAAGSRWCCCCHRYRQPLTLFPPPGATFINGKLFERPGENAEPEAA